MRNTWLIIQREYLQRVRTRTFLVLTILAPAIVTALMILPMKFATMSDGPEHLVIVTSNAQFGETMRQQLLATPVFDQSEGDSLEGNKETKELYKIDVDANPSDAERDILRGK